MDGKSGKFWLVWRERASSQSGELSSYLPKFRHPTEESARTEAERLARRFGGRFHVLELLTTAERDDIKWDEQPRNISIEFASCAIHVTRDEEEYGGEAHVTGQDRNRESRAPRR